MQVAVEAGLIQRRQRAEAHADRRELPELRHQARVRIAAQPFAVTADLATEMIEVVLAQSTFEECPGVDARCGVALEVDVVAGIAVVLAAEEVVEAGLVQCCAAGERAEVAADSLGVLVGLDDHHRCVPADIGTDALFQVLIAGEPWLVLAWDGVDVGRTDRRRETDLALASAFEQLAEQEPGSSLAVRVDHAVEAFQPLLRLGRVDVGKLVDESVKDHVASLSGLPGSSAQTCGGSCHGCSRESWSRSVVSVPVSPCVGAPVIQNVGAPVVQRVGAG